MKLLFCNGVNGCPHYKIYNCAFTSSMPSTIQAQRCAVCPLTIKEIQEKIRLNNTHLM